MDPNVPKIELQANKKKVPKIVLQANKKKDTEDLNDTDAKKHAGCGVIALMESARDDEDVGRFKDKWHKINLNKGVAKDVEFGEQETKLAKLYEDEKLAQALAELYEDEKLAQALAKLYQDEKQTRPLTNFLINVKHKEKLAMNWIKDEVRNIVQDVEGGGWRKKENQSQNGGEGGEIEAGCKGEKERVPDQKAKDQVEKDSRHVLNVIRNALPAIYPGRTALHMAAANGNVEIVRGICDVGNVDLNKRDVLGYTPLHLACYSTHPKRDEVIKILLASKHIDANVAAKEAGYYFTPLHLAIKAKSTDIVDMLLDWSPVGKNYSKVLDVDTKSTHGWTALHLAIKLKILEPDEGKKSDFKAMVVRLIRYMNKHSPEAINTSDETKRTPLHTCVEHKDYELVELLLEDGDKIDPELLDAKGRTSLEIAVHQGDYEMVQKIQRYLERSGLFGDHQAFADSANAILVGAALLVTVTFAAWVQIPTNDSTLFWVFISFSFYFAVATFIAAAGAAIPSRGSTLGLVRRAVLASAICLEISLGCAVAAFATAGFLILPPGKPQRKVIATTAIGGFVCFFFLLNFLRKITRALDPIFLWLDYKIQSLIKDHIWKPVTKGIKSRLVQIKGVTDLKEWYKEHVIDPDSTGSSHKKSEGSSRMGKGSGMTRSTSSMEDGSKPIIIETEA